MPARTLALRRAFFYLVARAGPLRVNRTAHLAANLALQCSAMRCSRPGAAHAAVKTIDFFSQVHRHPAAAIFGFGPVKRHTKRGATGAAILTGRHTLRAVTAAK